MLRQPLARKYRPQTFADLIGQDTVALALANSLRLDRTVQCLILSGTRGIGKTTTARLYAKALNCEHGPTPTPCGTCTSCQDIALGQHSDVSEIDGASNNGVDEIRALQETLVYCTQRSRFRVFIIDEVHMLSQSAFNALLKTLEEPPPHVVFILATTELHKIPQTVVGRCQAFSLKKIPLSTIAARLEDILTREGIPFESSVVFTAAKKGQGSLRDALTFLDQLIALSGGNLTEEAVQKSGIYVDTHVYSELLRALLEKDSRSCLQHIEGLDGKGVTFSSVLEELLFRIRGGFVLSTETDNALLQLSEQEVREIRAMIQGFSTLYLTKLFRHFMPCSEDLTGSSLDRLIFENICLEWCLVDQPVQQALPVTLPVFAATLPSVEEAETTFPAALESSSEKDDASFPGSWRQLIEQWKKVKPLQARKLEDVYPIEYSQQKIVVGVPPTSLIGDVLLQRDTQVKVGRYLKENFGFQGDFIAVDAQDFLSQGGGQAPLQSLLEIKAQERESLSSQKRADALSHPLTQGLVKAFDAKIIAVDLS